MRAEEHVRRLLLQSDRTPTGQLERSLLQSAVELSDAIGDDLLGYEARLRLSAWAAASGDSSTRLSAFDHCLERHIGDPLRFPASIGELDLLWDFASIPRMLAATPRYDRPTIEGCLDEMLEVFSLQGADLRAFDFARFEVAAALGDEALAAESLARVTGRTGERRDPEAAEPLLCDACVLSAEIAWHAERGRLDRAAAAADRLRESGTACADEPELALSRALVPYLLTDRLGDAREVHLEGYERVRNRPSHLEAVARHIEFAVMVGALQRALGMVERHARWLTADPLAVSAHFSFLCAAGGAMDALTRSGRGATVVSPADAPLLAAHLGARVGAWTATTFARACWAAAAERGAAFDTRNGNDRFARRLAAARAVRPVTAWETSSWGRAHPDRDARGSLPGRAARAVAAGATDAARAAEQRLAEPRVLLARARERAAVGDRPGAESAIDDALPRADPATRADLFALRIRMHVERGEMRAAEEQLEQRIDCLIVDDLDDDAELDLQLGLALFGAPLAGRETELVKALGRADELGLSRASRLRIAVVLATLFMQEQRYAEAETLLTDALAGVTDARRGAALLVLADAHFALGHAEQAIAALDQLLGDPIDRVLRASALLRRSSVLFTLDPAQVGEAIDAAIDDADRALALFGELDHCEGVLDACGVLGHLLGRVGSVEGSLEALRTAHRTAVRFEHPDVDAMAFRLACALVRADRGEEARTLLDDVVEQTAAGGEPAVRGVVFYWLGHAYRQDDDDPAAYCIWSLALEDFARIGDAPAAVRSGIALGRLLFDNDDPAAVPVLQEAARQARSAVAQSTRAPDGAEAAGRSGRGVPVATLLIDSLHLLGRAQAAFGDPAALVTLDDVMREALALHHLDPLLEASITESRARALDDLDREADAADLAREAARLYDAAGDRAAAARLFVFGARLSARRGNTDEADALYRESLTRYDEAAESGSSTAEARIERALAAQEQASLDTRLARPLTSPGGAEGRSGPAQVPRHKLAPSGATELPNASQQQQQQQQQQQPQPQPQPHRTPAHPAATSPDPAPEPGLDRASAPPAAAR
jgi:tetratricopeptide (TPR) repeat protein